MAVPPSGDGRRQHTGGPIDGQQQISAAAVIEGLENALALVDSDSAEHVTVGSGMPPAASHGLPRPG